MWRVHDVCRRRKILQRGKYRNSISKSIVPMVMSVGQSMDVDDSKVDL